jgi:hypothetical protein
MDYKVWTALSRKGPSIIPLMDGSFLLNSVQNNVSTLIFNQVEVYVRLST